jgi:hypothetical protein
MQRTDERLGFYALSARTAATILSGTLGGLAIRLIGLLVFCSGWLFIE